MKRILITLFAIGMTAMSSMSMAAMSNSQIRKETRFLTDKMAYELNMDNAQYNDVYEINYDFIYNIRYLMDDVARGYEWALNDYYAFLDVRNDDLRWVLSDLQYRRLLGLDYFVRPIYMNGPRWSFRVYINYPNVNLFFFGKPYHYRSYTGLHYRTYYNNVSYYRGRYNHNHYGNIYSVRDNRVYNNNRHSDFGSVRFRSNTTTRPSNISKNRPVPPAFGSSRGNNERYEGRSTNNANNNNSANRRGTETNRSTTNSSTNSGTNRGSSNNNSSRSTGRTYDFGSRSTDNSNRNSGNSSNSSNSRKESATPSRESSRPATPSRSTSTPSRSTSTATPSRSTNSSRSETPGRTESKSSSSDKSSSKSESRGSSSSRSSRSESSSSSSKKESSSSSDRGKSSSSSSRSSERGSSSRR